jgi:hypothetical protein
MNLIFLPPWIILPEPNARLLHAINPALFTCRMRTCPIDIPKRHSTNLFCKLLKKIDKRARIFVSSSECAGYKGNMTHCRSSGKPAPQMTFSSLLA